MTQGDSMQEAYEMAVDALGLALTSREQEKQPIPAASEVNQIPVGKDEYCVIIEFDMLAYKKRTNSKAVKKTLSIPEWLNEEAMSLGINFSTGIAGGSYAEDWGKLKLNLHKDNN